MPQSVWEAEYSTQVCWTKNAEEPVIAPRRTEEDVDQDRQRLLERGRLLGVEAGDVSEKLGNCDSFFGKNVPVSIFDKQAG